MVSYYRHMSMTTIDKLGTINSLKSLPDRLIKARENAGYSRAEFAQAMGVTPQALRNYESGRREPARAYILAWAHLTGWPAGWLETGMASADEAEAIENLLWSRLSDLNRRPVLYKDATCPDFVPAWMVDAVSERQRVVDARTREKGRWGERRDAAFSRGCAANDSRCGAAGGKGR